MPGSLEIRNAAQVIEAKMPSASRDPSVPRCHIGPGAPHGTGEPDAENRKLSGKIQYFI